MDRPELVKLMIEDPDNYQIRVSNIDHPAIVKRIGQNPEVVVGVMGEPQKASVELGARIAQEAVAGLAELIGVMEGG